jgi:hypothetical protein
VAGETALVRIDAGREFASAGSVAVLGASPVNSDEVPRPVVRCRQASRSAQLHGPARAGGRAVVLPELQH